MICMLQERAAFISSIALTAVSPLGNKAFTILLEVFSLYRFNGATVVFLHSKNQRIYQSNFFNCGYEIFLTIINLGLPKALASQSLTPPSTQSQAV